MDMSGAFKKNYRPVRSDCRLVRVCSIFLRGSNNLMKQKTKNVKNRNLHDVGLSIEKGYKKRKTLMFFSFNINFRLFEV